MKKELYDAMIRLCVDSFHDINWEWDGLTTSERIAIGSKEIFHKLHEEASDFLIVKPSSPHYEAVLLRCNPKYAESNSEDVRFFTSVEDHWVPEWGILKMPEEGAEYDECEEQDMYFCTQSQAIAKAEELNNQSKILSDSDSQRKDHFHVVLTLCAPEFEESFPDRVDPVWTTIREHAHPVWTVFKEPHYAIDKIEWIGSMEFESISLAHQYADNMNKRNQ
jgi:hypothetical protein